MTNFQSAMEQRIRIGSTRTHASACECREGRGHEAVGFSHLAGHLGH